jgi:hypothetical protein
MESLTIFVITRSVGVILLSMILLAVSGLVRSALGY